MPQPAWVKGRLASEPFISRLWYNLVVKRSSTYMTAVMVVATSVGARDARPKMRPRPAAAPPRRPARPAKPVQASATTT